MASSKETKVTYARVKSSARKGTARRRPASVIVKVNGISRMNAQATAELLKVVLAAGLSKGEFVVWYGVNEQTGCVAIYVAKPGTENTTLVRVHGEKSVYLHLGSIFDEYPSLRPTTQVQAAVMSDEDAAGQPCLVIQLKGALEKHSVPRKRRTAAQPAAEAK